MKLAESVRSNIKYINKKNTTVALYVLAAIFFIAGFCAVNADTKVPEDIAVISIESQIANRQQTLAKLESSPSLAEWQKQDVEKRKTELANIRAELAETKMQAKMTRRRQNAGLAQYYVLAAGFMLAAGFLLKKS